MPGRGSSILALALAGSWASALRAQEEALESRGPEPSLAVLLRTSRLLGTVDQDSDVGFQNLWSAGIGLAVEGELAYPVGRRGWRLGSYLQTGFDSLPGGDDADFGDSLVADDLLLTHFLAGFKVKHTPERGLFFDARLGFGAVHFGEAEGEIRVGGITSDIKIFESTTVFAGEIGTHLGYSGNTAYAAIGFVLRFQGEPDGSDDIQFHGTSGTTLAALELEIGFRF